jgi:hypothetical protein
MGNIKNYKYKKLDLRLSNSDYWDFYLANDDDNQSLIPVIPTTGDCAVVWFDFNESEIYLSGITSSKTISSLYSWTGATNTGYTFSTIGLTGIDNGLVTFEKNPLDPTNQALLSALTGTTLVIPSGDSRFHMNRVTGTTGDYIYPIDILNDNSGDYAQMCGGFYQGYYKIDGSTYQVLPNRVNKAWVAQFWLKRDSDSCSGYTGTTLNETYPNNKGFFFYMGTRAENKFWNLFEGADTGCTSACTIPTGCTDILSDWCTIPKETDISISGSNGVITLYPNQTITEEITNPFLVYGRAGQAARRCASCGAYEPSGLATKTVCTWDGTPIEITKPKTIVTNTENPFLVYGRAGAGNVSSRCVSCGNPSGFGNETVCSFSGFVESIQFDNLDYKLDIIDNALGFRIKDDGSIGYRLLSVTGQCSGVTGTTASTYVSGVTVQEGYSSSGMVQNNAWTSVIIRYTMDEYYDDCDFKYKKPRTGKLMFYINGRLKFVVNNFSEFIARRLEEHMEKQVGVPFNMSLGGGSQGLIETQTFDGRDDADLGLPIEENFAGTFIGGISQFKFNICDLYFNDIQNIYISEVTRYYPLANNLLLQENGYWILQEDNSGIEQE